MGYVLKTTRGWGSPGRYIQGPGEINRLAEYTGLYGKKVAAIIDPFFYKELSELLKKQYNSSGGEIVTIEFQGEVSERKIAQACEQVLSFHPEVVIGIGGGKSLDTAKAVAYKTNAVMVIVPTSASTDAPTSALSVVYKDNGEHSHAMFYHKNPELVLVDSAIIAKAPIRYLISGMGDALSTVFEARANDLSDTANYIWFEQGGYRRCKSSLCVAELCYNTVMEKGLLAKMAAEQGILTEALEDVIEANTLMSGLGFENTGCAGAHSVGDGITALPVGAKTLHGEKVAFGVLCQLVSENAPKALVEEVIAFCLSVELPVTLEELYVEPTDENLHAIAKASLNSFWSAEPFHVTEDQIVEIVKTADILGHHYKNLER